MDKTKLEELRKLVSERVVKFDVSLYDLDYVNENNTNYLRVLIENEQGVMDLDTCVSVSEDLSLILDKIDYLNEEYVLEVSSPGAERPLKEFNQFVKAIGKYVYIKTKNPIEKQYYDIYGTLKEVNQDKILLEVQDKTRIRNIEIELSNIESAMTTVKL